MIHTKIVKRTSEIKKDEWDKVFPSVLEGYNFFKSLDESGFEQFSFYYIMVYDDDRIVGIAPCFFMAYPLDTSISGPAKNFVEFVKKIIPGAFSIRSIVCGIPMTSARIGISGEPSIVLKAICDGMEKLAKDLKAPIIAFKDFGRSHLDILDNLTKQGFAKFNSLPSAEMDINFKNFEEYMMKLSHSTRYDLRRKFKKADGNLNMKMEVRNSLDDDTLGGVYSLYLQAVKEHEIGFEVVPKEFFKNIYKNMPKESKFFLWRIDGKLAAFVFALVSEDFFNAYYLGLDYSIAYDYHLYFLRFRDIMKWCIENKIKKYDVGVTGYEPKKRLNFNFVPFYIYAKHRNNFIRPIFNTFCSCLKFENYDPVLKEIMKDIK